MPGVYVSYPFCRQKCTFCNFASGVHPPQLEADYLRILKVEIERARLPFTPDTVYWGGGTPSSLNLDSLAELMRLIPGRPWREATLEAAPGTIDDTSARAWLEMGFTRISLGVQSFVDCELRQTGRVHDAAMVEREVGILRQGGFRSINLDLIAGLPHQTPESWQVSLDAIIALRPEHVSVYIFEVDEESRLGAEVLLNGKKFGAPLIPTDDVMADLYRTAVAFLARHGWDRYEISNFAQSGHESIHNLKYWRREPYVGFGADAHSFDGRLRWSNVETTAAYVAGELADAPAPAIAEEERLYLGLRLTREGLRLEPREIAESPAIQKHLYRGLLQWDGQILRLTDEGVLLSNDVFQDFLLEPQPV